MSVFDVVAVEDAGDARLADYRALKEQRLREDSGKFVAESEGVVMRLLASPLEVASVMVNAAKSRALQNAQTSLLHRREVPLYVVPQAVMDAVAGFHVHRGCLAIGHRPEKPTLPAKPRVVLVLEELVDVENVGGVVRNAAAFGADALLLSPHTADPYYRKAIRVAMGNTFSLPLVRATKWPEDVLAYRAATGAMLVGAVVQPEHAVQLPHFAPDRPVLLALGSEGPGLSEALRSQCDALVTIPMDAADSLNVATAAAIVLYHLRHAVPAGQPRR